MGKRLVQRLAKVNVAGSTRLACKLYVEIADGHTNREDVIKYRSYKSSIYHSPEEFCIWGVGPDLDPGRGPDPPLLRTRRKKSPDNGCECLRIAVDSPVEMRLLLVITSCPCGVQSICSNRVSSSQEMEDEEIEEYTSFVER